MRFVAQPLGFGDGEQALVDFGRSESGRCRRNGRGYGSMLVFQFLPDPSAARIPVKLDAAAAHSSAMAVESASYHPDENRHVAVSAGLRPPTR